MFKRERVISGFSAHRVGGGVSRRQVAASPPPSFSLSDMGLTPTAIIDGVQAQMTSNGGLLLAFLAFGLGLAWLPKVKRALQRTGR